MEELTNKIQAVINTLEGLDIKSTFDICIVFRAFSLPGNA